MSHKVEYADDGRSPIRTLTVMQPKGTLDLTLNKNKKGNRIRISNADGMVLNVSTDKVASFIDALNKVATRGVKVSQQAA